MPKRPFFLLLLVLLISGCARLGEEQIARYDAAADAVEAQSIRLALLEARVNAMGAVAPANPAGPAPTSKPTDRNVVAQAEKGRGQKPAPVARQAAVSENIAREYQYALAMAQGGKPITALPLFSDFLRSHPDSFLAPNAEYWLGECYYATRKYAQALTVFKDVVAKYPTHDKAAAAMLKAGYSYQMLDDGDNARLYLEALIRDFPGSSPAALARQRLASL